MKIGNRQISGIFVWDNVHQLAGGSEIVTFQSDDVVIYPGGIYRCTVSETTEPPGNSSNWEHIIAANCTLAEFKTGGASNKFVTAKVVRDSLYNETDGMIRFMTSDCRVKSWKSDIANINHTSVYACDKNTINKPGISNIGIIKTSIPEDNSVPCVQEYIALSESPMSNKEKILGIYYRIGSSLGDGTVNWDISWQQVITPYGATYLSDKATSIARDYVDLINYFNESSKTSGYKYLEVDSLDETITYASMVNEINHIKLVKILVKFKSMVGNNQQEVVRWVDVYLNELRYCPAVPDPILIYVGTSIEGDVHLSLTSSLATVLVNGVEQDENSSIAKIVKYLGFMTENV